MAKREELIALMEARDAMTAEIEALTSALEGPGMPGVKGPLVDREGFPLANVDLYQVRTQRQRLACLHTDYKEITSRIEKGLLEVLARPETSASPTPRSEDEARAAPPSRPPNAGASSNRGLTNGTPTTSDSSAAEARAAVAASSPVLEPFASVRGVEGNSPASRAGLRTGDLILRFGPLQKIRSSTQPRDNASLVRSMPLVINDHKEVCLEISVQRDGELATLTLLPLGAERLGCHVVPL